MAEKTINARKLEGRTHIPKINYEQCINCLICQYTCPDLAITRDKSKENPVQIDLNICRGCGLCAAICPKEAVTMEVED